MSAARGICSSYSSLSSWNADSYSGTVLKPTTYGVGEPGQSFKLFVPQLLIDKMRITVGVIRGEAGPVTDLC